MDILKLKEEIISHGSVDLQEKNGEYQKILGTRRVHLLSPLLFKTVLQVTASAMKQENKLKA